MRVVLLAILGFTCLSSVAWMEIELTSMDYLITAKLYAGSGGEAEGSVTMRTQDHGICTGTYVMDPTKGSLLVSLDNTTAIYNDCAVESFRISMTPISGYENLKAQKTIPVKFYSAKFRNNQKGAMLKVINHGTP